MTKSLTEQWKDGELEYGYYYIKIGIGCVPMLFNGQMFYCEYTSLPNSVKEVLAPVPSYEEYKEMDNDLKEIASKNDSLAMECGKLQEQLKEANAIINLYFPKDKKINTVCVKPINDYRKKWGVK